MESSLFHFVDLILPVFESLTAGELVKFKSNSCQASKTYILAVA
jgi:hypothetical protein